MGKILVGTASWTDPSLVKSRLFYPKDAKTPEDRLRYHASRFPLVEVDSSYYAMPSASNSEKCFERTPADSSSTSRRSACSPATAHGSA
jgi:uncharacterized protein YecE (DUF72 family)